MYVEIEVFNFPPKKRQRRYYALNWGNRKEILLVDDKMGLSLFSDVGEPTPIQVFFLSYRDILCSILVCLSQGGRYFFETGSLARFRITYNVQGGLVVQEKMILVSCPKCGIKINNTSSWFKKPGSCF